MTGVQTCALPIFGETSLKEVRDMMSSKGLVVGQSLGAAKPAAITLVREDLAPEVRAKMELTVADLNLTVRSRKCLSRLGITTLPSEVSPNIGFAGASDFNQNRSEIRSRFSLFVAERHGHVAQLLTNFVQRCHTEVANRQQFVGGLRDQLAQRRDAQSREALS